MKTSPKITLSFLPLVFAAFAFAGQAALVVKQEGQKVYLDVSGFAPKPAVGAGFTISQKGSEIVNPQTGKVLGMEITSQYPGRVTLVEQDYALGQLAQDAQVLGLEAVFEPAPAVAAAPSPAAPAQEGEAAPLWQSQQLDAPYKAAAAGNFTGAASQLALAFEDNTIGLFAVEDGELKNILTHKISPLRKIISLDAADIKNTGAAQLFATVFDSATQKLNTLVLEFSGGVLQQSANIKGFVKGIAPGNGPRRLYAQEVSPSGKMTTPSELVYQNGKFGKGAKLSAPGFKNIFGFNMADFAGSGKPNIIYAANHALRVQYDKKHRHTDTPEGMDFATTPLRLKVGDEVLRLPLSIALFGEGKNITVAAVENRAKLGLLADTFGSYQSAKLHFLAWRGDSFAQQKSADIAGVVYDIVQAPLGGFGDVIIVPYNTAAGGAKVLLFSAK